MADGDYYLLTDTQDFNGNSVENVYSYEALQPATSASELTSVFIADVLPTIVSIQSLEITHNLITTVNLFDAADFQTTVVSVPGTYGGTVDALPPHDTMSYTLHPDDTIVRPGGKRFAGITEQSQDNGVISDIGLIPNMESLRTVLVQILKEILGGVIDHYAPIIIKRIKEGIAPDFTYRLPKNQTEANSAGLLTAEFSPFVLTQASRKLNRA